jgi:hypothetical protein
MELDLAGWSGEGAFTRAVIDALRGIEEIALVKVEDAPSSRAEAGYAFISNEIFLVFRQRRWQERVRRFGWLPGRRVVTAPAATLATVEAALAALDGIGPPDYADEGMLQYLRTERIIPPYQRKGYKQIELVRIYEAGRGPRVS